MEYENFLDCKRKLDRWIPIFHVFNHIIIELLPCARNFVIKTELFNSKVMW